MTQLIVFLVYMYKGVFPTIDCQTLFLPAVKKKLLMDLSKVSFFNYLTVFFLAIIGTSFTQRTQGFTVEN